MLDALPIAEVTIVYMKNLINETPIDEIAGKNFFTAKFVDHKFFKQKNILDVGCGFGWFMNHALGLDAKFVAGIEIDDKNFEVIKKYVDAKKSEVKVGSATDIPYKDNEFDTVVSWEVIEHIPVNTEKQMFKEVNRVLKSGGIFYLSTPFNNIFSNILDPAWWLIGHRHYSKDKLSRFGKENGFEVLQLEPHGNFWELLWMLNLYFCKWFLRRKPVFKGFFEERRNKGFLSPEGITHIFACYKKVKSV